MQLIRRFMQLRTRVGPAVFRRMPRALRSLLRWLLAGKRRIIVLGGHNGEAFDDNSRAMAIYLSKDPSNRLFWVRSGPHLSGVLHHGIAQLKKGSLYAELVISVAHCIYYSHGVSDITRGNLVKAPWRKIIYLGHGVWGFKRVERRRASERNKEFDLTICVSREERKLKSAILGCDEKSILPVGLPKHDAFFEPKREQKEKRRKLVLYAPTWRDWLQHKPSDIAVERHFDALASLAQHMPAHDGFGDEIEMAYLIHKNIGSLSGIAESICASHEISCLVSSDNDVNKLLIEADYLISDYSGLLWDFIIQGKPAARYLFDKHVYESLTGSYAQIETLASCLSFDEASDVWGFLFRDEALTAATSLAESAVQFSTGGACERLSLMVDTLLREGLEDFPSRFQEAHEDQPA